MRFIRTLDSLLFVCINGIHVSLIHFFATGWNLSLRRFLRYLTLTVLSRRVAKWGFKEN